MPQPPALRLQRRERALDLVLRASADSTATSERKPVASVEAEPDGCEEQQPGERRRSRARDRKPEQRGDDASQAALCRRERAGGTAGGARSSRCDRLELTAAAGRALARPELCHRSILSPAPDGPDPVDYRPEIRPVLCGHGRRIFLQPAPTPAPKAPFRSPQDCSFAGRKLVPYRDSNQAVATALRTPICVTSVSTFMSTFRP